MNLIEVKEDLMTPIEAASTHSQTLCQWFRIERKKAQLLLKDEALRSLEARYASWDWRYGKSIDFDLRIDTGRHPWGQAELLFKVEQGILKDVLIYSDALDSDFFREISESLVGLRFHSEENAKRVEMLGSDRNTVGEISKKKMRMTLGLSSATLILRNRLNQRSGIKSPQRHSQRHGVSAAAPRVTISSAANRSAR